MVNSSAAVKVNMDWIVEPGLSEAKTSVAWCQLKTAPIFKLSQLFLEEAAFSSQYFRCHLEHFCKDYQVISVRITEEWKTDQIVFAWPASNFRDYCWFQTASIDHFLVNPVRMNVCFSKLISFKEPSTTGEITFVSKISTEPLIQMMNYHFRKAWKERAVAVVCKP